MSKRTSRISPASTSATTSASQPPREAAPSAILQAATPPHSAKGESKKQKPSRKRDAAPARTGSGRARQSRKAPGSTVKAPRPSGLSSAHAVLLKSKRPMNVRELTDAMLKQKLWTTKGKTPSATIAAAIMREIAAKGKTSRFVKSGPGLFSARDAARTAR